MRIYLLVTRQLRIYLSAVRYKLQANALILILTRYHFFPRQVDLKAYVLWNAYAEYAFLNKS